MKQNRVNVISEKMRNRAIESIRKDRENAKQLNLLIEKYCPMKSI